MPDQERRNPHSDPEKSGLEQKPGTAVRSTSSRRGKHRRDQDVAS